MRLIKYSLICLCLILGLICNADAAQKVNGVTSPAKVNGVTNPGKVNGVTFSYAKTVTPGTPYAIEAVAGGNTAAIASLTSTTAIAIVGDNTNHQTNVVVLSVSGSTITAGAIEMLDSHASYNGTTYNICALSSTLAIATWGAHVDGHIQAVCLSISGTTITVNSPMEVMASINNNSKLVSLSATQAMYVYDLSTGTDCDALILSVSGTTITANAITAISETNAYCSSGDLNKITSTSVLFTFQDAADSYKPTSCLLTVSGTTITVNTFYDLYSNANQTVKGCRLSDTKAVTGYSYSSGGPYDTWGAVLDFSGTVITVGTRAQVDSAQTSMFKLLSLSATQVLFLYKDGTNTTANANIGNIATSTLTLETETPISALGNITTFDGTSLSSSLVITLYKDPGDTYMYAQAITIL